MNTYSEESAGKVQRVATTNQTPPMEAIRTSWTRLLLAGTIFSLHLEKSKGFVARPHIQKQFYYRKGEYISQHCEIKSKRDEGASSLSYALLKTSTGNYARGQL